MKNIIKIHLLIEVITNSSTEIFVLDDSKSESFVEEILKNKCELEDDLEWFQTEVTVTTRPDGCI